MRFYSNSEFQTFKDCKRKWWLGWYRGLRPRRFTPVSAAHTGTLVHEALAPWYVPEGAEPRDPRDVLGWLSARDRALIVETHQDDEEGASGALAEYAKQLDLVRTMIEGYMEWLEQTGADSEFEVIGSEQVVQLEVKPLHTLVARLDVRVRRLWDGARLFLDHKTTTSFTDLQRQLQQTEQMPTYLILERAAGAAQGEQTEGAIYNGLRKVKRGPRSNPPYYDRFPKTYNGHELESMWIRIQATMRDIELAEGRLRAGEDHRFAAPPRPNADCHWKCEFYPVCPMFDDGSRAEDMLEHVYVVGDQLDRYPELTGGTPVYE